MGISGLLLRSEDRKDVQVKHYCQDFLPKHLSNPDFYFRKFETCIKMENIQAESESEMTKPKITV